ncbi:hypothetical protein K493DRAFT_333089 [Basidiobolus meristosporus CBS 931.73]|uniref:Heparan-alpha-glucosaminide N-acetyltransferase catalytic domain-containing protein n=1 Tax=Basidiobolus meristosporus CBS 931.73 TaxID=1314790 RepID=A0A1Y1Z8J8_9FUNG|nr:hypothetical protein K493DRAFT_307950 [Basidiobolus meristosporus CBS 931.73]ORY06592.1 hypothetical protein K493DRAFT_333089 [Basidiobolus meristosporus CBS 931.73]|eukprot:ORX81915.1 hypothetical protein K493DRAFT_307950 [Basidiobolus meristosporus CBS 931.73]
MDNPASLDRKDPQQTSVEINQETIGQPKKSGRLVSLDVCRGFTIIFMIMVNYQPEPFPIMEHPEWFGFTLADAIFPNFVFIMGLAIPLAMAANRGKLEGKRLWIKVVKRFVLIFLIGLWVNLFPFSSPDFPRVLRIPGVLQRLAICYLVLTALYITCHQEKNRYQYLYLRYGFPLSALLLWLALTYGVNVPGCGHGILTIECSAESYFDTNIFGLSHTYQQLPFDPEGSLSTITSCINCWIGMMVGIDVVKHRTEFSEKSFRYKRVCHYTMIALIGIVLAIFIHTGIPISKPLWTPTFVLLTGGISILLLAIFIFLIDIKNLLQSPIRPIAHLFNMFVVVGKNPLFLYVLSENLASIFFSIPVPYSGHGSRNGMSNLYNVIYSVVFASWLPAHLASLIWSLVWALLVYVPIAYLMDYKKWYVKL